MGMEQEWQRLQELYAAMGDNELLDLARDKAGLTEVAQEALGNELVARNLTASVEQRAAEAEAEVDPEEELLADDPEVIELMTFQIAGDAERTFTLLDHDGIPARMEPAMRRMVEGGPLVKTNWLTLFIEARHRDEAQAVLRNKMGLFPELAPEEKDYDADAAAAEGELSIVGSFDDTADVAVVKRVLTEAGIWFEAEGDTDGQSNWTIVMARPGDVDRAMDVVAAAFADE